MKSNSRIRVLLLNAPITVAGAEKVIMMQLANVNREKYELKLGCFISCKRPKNLFIEEVRKQSLGEPYIFPMRKTIELNHVLQLREFIVREKIQILHTHGYRSDIIGFLSTRKTRTPIIATVHGWTPLNSKLRVYEWLDRRFLPYFDRIICVAESIKNQLRQLGISEKKLIRMANAIDTTRYVSLNSNAKRELCQQWQIAPDSILIGTVGRLSPEKGFDYLFSAFAKVHAQYAKTKLVIVGEGLERNKLERLAQKLRISDDVIFCGQQQAIGQYYAAFDLFVLSSITEGLPISLLEAMASGKSSIATAVGGIPDLIKNGETGLLVLSKNSEKLAQALLWALEHPAQMQAMAMNAKTKVLPRYSVTDWSQRLEIIYQEVVHAAPN